MWVTKPHRCSLPTRSQYRPDLSDLFECDYCKRTWKVTFVSTKDDYHYRVGFKLYDPYKFKDYISD